MQVPTQARACYNATYNNSRPTAPAAGCFLRFVVVPFLRWAMNWCLRLRL